MNKRMYFMSTKEYIRKLSYDDVKKHLWDCEAVAGAAWRRRWFKVLGPNAHRMSPIYEVRRWAPRWRKDTVKVFPGTRWRKDILKDRMSQCPDPNHCICLFHGARCNRSGTNTLSFSVHDACEDVPVWHTNGSYFGLKRRRFERRPHGGPTNEL